MELDLLEISLERSKKKNGITIFAIYFFFNFISFDDIYIYLENIFSNISPFLTNYSSLSQLLFFRSEP